MLFFLLVFSAPFFGFEKLDPKYCPLYGNPEAPHQVVEYFSLSCPKCMDFFKHDFPAIKAAYVDTGVASWTLHPDPADLLTLQAMVCLDRLPPEHRLLFLEAVMNSLAKLKSNEGGSSLMQSAMEALENPIPELDRVEFLKETEAFEHAYAFVKQEDVVKEIPSVEIDGVFYNKYPAQKLFDEHINNLKRSS